MCVYLLFVCDVCIMCCLSCIAVCYLVVCVCRIPYHQDDIAKSLVRLISDCCQQDGALPKLKSPGKPRTKLPVFTIIIILEFRILCDQWNYKMLNNVAKMLPIIKS